MSADIRPVQIVGGQAVYHVGVDTPPCVLADLVNQVTDIATALAAQGVAPEDMKVDIETGFEFGEPWVDLVVTATRPATAEEHAVAERRRRSAIEDELARARARVAELERHVQTKADGV